MLILIIYVIMALKKKYSMILKLLKDKNRKLKALALMLEFLAIGLVIYLIALPIWPALEYKYLYQNKTSAADFRDLKKVARQTEQIVNHLPKTKNISANRLIITKIGVNAPIVETDNVDDGLNKGAWRIPESSTPDQSGNTVITGHRFKYLPPNNLTFFLFDKLVKDDLVSVVWRGKKYFYKIKETKIIKADDLSILEPTAGPTLTLYTCDPIYSQENRLAVISELIEQ